MSVVNNLKSGEKARLIPVGSEKNLERRATSIFLATMQVVEEFAFSMLGSIGQKVGVRSSIECFTEVVLPQADEKKDRPDGLIVLKVGKREWTALIEAKIGNAELDKDQVERYLSLAKIHKIDAVITISNQFSALPTHHPIKVGKNLTKNVGFFHWSWMFMITQAIYQLKIEQDIDPEQRYLLEEMVRYFEHPSSGVKTFDSMNKEWKETCLQVKNGRRLVKASDALQNTLGSWYQVQRNISLMLTRELKVPVSIRIKNPHRKDPEKRLKDDCNELVQTQILKCSFDVPDAANVLNVEADIARRTVSCTLQLDAPTDKKTTKARVNWLLRQLNKAKIEGLSVTAKWPSRTPDTNVSLAKIKEDYQLLQCKNSKLAPSKFEVILRRDLAGRFSGSRTFLEGLNSVIIDFYREAGEHLQAWVPPAPKLPEIENILDE